MVVEVTVTLMVVMVEVSDSQDDVSGCGSYRD